jgi:hypothetical protein
MKTHSEDEFCADIKADIKEQPALVSGAANFVSTAGQYRLATSQDIGNTVNKINQLVGTNLKGYEGTHQFARDIQVFKRLNEEAFVKKGVFQTAERAKEYLDNATAGQHTNLSAKLSGYGQEVDWLREQQGKISSLWQKSELLNGNAPGVDGVTVNRFTGETISRTTVKAAQVHGSLSTNVNGVVKALKKGTLQPDEIVFGDKGTKEALQKALNNEIAKAKLNGNSGDLEKLIAAKGNLRVEEHYTPEQVKGSVDRLKDKIQANEAVASIGPKQLASKMAGGAIIGAAIGLTVSAITSYISYRKGELTREEAFTDIGEGTTKGIISGAAMAGITLFLPAGPVGVIAGCAIGMYLNETLKNVLDEVFGKGAYREILIAGGYTMGTATNLSEALQQFKSDRAVVAAAVRTTEQKNQNTRNILDMLENKRRQK